MTCSSLLPTSEQAKRVAGIFHRKVTTKWTKKEIASFRALKPLDEDDLGLVERYYRANWPPWTGHNILRHDLGTFLNNYPGEVDRARIWCEQHKPKPVYRKIIPLKLPEQEMTEAERIQAETQFEKLMGRKPKLSS